MFWKHEVESVAGSDFDNPTGEAGERPAAVLGLALALYRWRTKFSGGVPVRPRDIAHDLRLLIAERTRG